MEGSPVLTEQRFDYNETSTRCRSVVLPSRMIRVRITTTTTMPRANSDTSVAVSLLDSVKIEAPRRSKLKGWASL
jgi:hypothetical protein